MRMLLVVAAIGCQRAPAPEPPPPPPAISAPRAAAPPFVINNHIVGEDGRVLRDIAGADGGDLATPDGPHRFRIGDRLVDTAAGTTVPVWPAARFEPGAGESSYRLTRYEPDGRVRWQVPLAGVRSVRTPDVATGGGRVIATIGNRIHAFDDATGAPAWQAGVEGFSLAIRGDALYSIDCNEPTGDHWLIAHALADGKERFRAPLAKGCDPSLSVDERRIVVVDERERATRIFDPTGALLLRLPEIAQSTYPLGDGALIVTDKHVARLDETGRVRWQLAPLPNGFVGGNAFATLPGGDVVIANYGAISDSGAAVVRLRPDDGSVVWRAQVPGLGVSHSQYLHAVYLEVRGDALYVVSQGSGGGLLERLATATGARTLRCVIGDGRCTP